MTIHFDISPRKGRLVTYARILLLMNKIAGLLRPVRKPLYLSDIDAAQMDDLDAGREIRHELARREWDSYR